METAPVLVLGAASWNRMVQVPSLPQGVSATVFEAKEWEAAGSTGVGKAMALAGLGQPVVLHCALGRDREADLIEAACRARGIQMLIDRQETPTPRHLNIMDNAGGRYSIFVEPGTSSPVVDAAAVAALLAQTDTVFLSLCASSLALLPLLADFDGDVLLDLHDYDGQNPWHDPFIDAADVVQLSDVALDRPETVVQRLLDGPARQVVLTKGSAGAEIWETSGRVDIPAVPVVLKDSNGAGDAFSVALWQAQRDGLETEAAGRFAATVAAMAVESDALFPKHLSRAEIAARQA